MSSKQKSVNPLSEQLVIRLREVVIILSFALAIFMLLALSTFHQTDPGWSNTGSANTVQNMGGIVGAWFSDILLYLFGYAAYGFPFLLGVGAYRFLGRRGTAMEIHGMSIFARTIGFLFIITSTCGLFSIHLSHLHAHLPFTSGGIIGNLVGLGLASSFNDFGASLVMSALLLSGVTLLTGLSWLSLLDITGKKTLGYFQVIFEKLKNLKIKKPEIIKQNKPIIARAKSERIKPKIEAPKADIAIVPSKTKKPSKPPVFDIPVSGTLPGVGLLDKAEKSNKKGYTNAQLEEMSKLVELRLLDFGVQAHVVAVHPGPVITRFELDLAPGVKVSKLTGLAKDLARSLSVTRVRVVEVIPGKSVVGLELPNQHREIVRFSEVISSDDYQHADSPLSMALGKDIAGKTIVVDLGKMPHLLVAGTTGSGKSVGLNSMLLSILYKSTPSDVRMILIDPKMLELSIYDGIPHLLTPVVTDMKLASNALRWCVAEMERRYQLMAALGVRNLAGYNQKIKEALDKNEPITDPLFNPNEHITEAPQLETLPYIMVIVDEFADMMMVVGKKVEILIARIAQKARAAGIHMIIATQRPSVDVITGLIKANIPTRIGFQVSSRVDSRTILDQLGAEQLLGHGDMLYLPPGTAVPMRVHGAFVADDEVHRVVQDWKRRGEPHYIDDIVSENQPGASLMGSSDDNSESDPLYDEAVAFITKSRRPSISSIQRRLKIGYNRAARIMEDMEKAGVVSSMDSNGSREVLAPPPIED